MEHKDAPLDDKLAHKDAVKKAFGDGFEYVGCEEVFNNSKQVLFCEMLIKSATSSRI